MIKYIRGKQNLWNLSYRTDNDYLMTLLVRAKENNNQAKYLRNAKKGMVEVCSKKVFRVVQEARGTQDYLCC